MLYLAVLAAVTDEAAPGTFEARCSCHTIGAFLNFWVELFLCVRATSLRHLVGVNNEQCTFGENNTTSSVFCEINTCMASTAEIPQGTKHRF